LSVSNGTNFITALYCHHFGSCDVIGHVIIRHSVVVTKIVCVIC